MAFTPETIAKLRSVVDAATDPSTGGVSGLTGIIFDKAGTHHLSHSAGRIGVSSSTPLTPSHVVWLASCTKAVTVLCVMQLVERGELALDDADQLEGLLPEVAAAKVLREDGTLEEKRGRITLRMLLTHTAGFGYSCWDANLRDYGLPIGIDELSGRREDYNNPLLFHPGEKFKYGIGTDWAGIALERVTKMSLGEYMNKNVFTPLGLSNIGMVPTAEMKANLVHMSQRTDAGEMVPRDHAYRRPLVSVTQAELDVLFHSGGAGLFASPEDYCRILTVFLNDGLCPTTNTRLLSAATVAEIFTNQIPQFPDFARTYCPAAKPHLTCALSEIHPTGDARPQGWGLASMLTGGVTGRPEGTASWAGLANLFWWVDRENGVGGFVASQVLPFGEAKVMEAWFGLEMAIYAALKEAKQ